MGAKAIAIHGRTRAQMYKGEADWTMIAEVKNNQRMTIPVFGNGDVNSPEKARIMRDDYGLDGAMIGRASIGNPWFFKQVKEYLETKKTICQPSLEERIITAKRHLEMAIKWKGERLGLLETRRHYSNYFRGIANFKPFRTRLVTGETTQEVMTVFDELEEIKTHLEVIA